MNRKESAKYFKMAADNGDVFAMYQYSKKVHIDDGVKKDLNEQFKYLKMAADKENLEEMFSYAVLLDKWIETNVNKQQAAKFYKNSADKGLDHAIMRYAEMALSGDGIPKDIDEGLRYLKMASEKVNISVLKLIKKLTK